MKILDKYLLKTYLFTFATVFVILFFIFILQTIWLFIAELAGKDLDLAMVVKFLLFSMPRIIPLVLPLSILLASIMTFGSLAENYEFAAMKSSGISLQRAMRSLVIFITLFSFVAFLFANNVIPYAEYRFINFRKNIAQVKPALAIAEGQFSDVGIYNIKVNKKSGENGSILKGITIHKTSVNSNGGKTVIKALEGKLISSEKSNILKLELNNGNYYEDVVPTNYEDRKKNPFAKSVFKKYTINIDLSSMDDVDVDKKTETNSNTMLNVNELTYTIDSLKLNMTTEVVAYTENLNSVINLRAPENLPIAESESKSLKAPKNLLEKLPKGKILEILTSVSGSLNGTKYSLEASTNELKEKQKNINKHLIAFNEKFVIAYACFLMFFIGAPLGAIIRKGGLGLPIIFAVLIFITFHFINTFGKRLSQEDGLSPFMGTWMASFILTPLAVFLTYRATNDIGLINLPSISLPFQQFLQKCKNIIKVSVAIFTKK